MPLEPSDRDRYQRRREIFLQVRDLPTAERSKYLDEACSGDADLRREVEALLASEEHSTDDPLAPLPVTPGGLNPPATKHPESVGPYKILGEPIGEGGMGIVYLAEQDHPRRKVALKLIRPGMTSTHVLRRFKYEAELLGRLQHPGIAQIYEAGSVDALDSEQPFFAMELVQGVPLTQYAEQKGLGTRDRLALLAGICDAVHHAHQQGIIHRDLKPKNILVTETGQPKVLDFGVARATDADLQSTTARTDVGQLIGTVPYMSPEQVGGDPAELDTRSDVYAMGVLAYELLAGALPYDLGRKLIHEAVRVIREDAPTPLSSVNRALRGDVETIVGKALEKEKARRYQSASDLAGDIRRYLADEPILARPQSRVYQARKFALRNKALVGGVVGIFVALVLGVIGTSIGMVRAWNAEAAAEAARVKERRRADELKLVADFQVEQLSGIDVPMMAVRLRRGLLEKVREVGEQSRTDADALPDRVAAFEKLLAGADLTGLSVSLLDENIFKGALSAIEKQFADQPLVKSRLLQALTDVQSDLGLLDAATAPQTEALAIRREQLGDDHPDTLSSINNMGALLLSQGKQAEAELYIREALEGRRRVLGDDHIETLRSINNMGILLQFQRKFAEAEPYIREAMEIARRVLGDDDPTTLASISNMGVLLQWQGKFAEAEPYGHEALEGHRRILGNDHMETVKSINNIGTLLQFQRRLAEAEPYTREAMESCRRLLGDDHPTTLSSINNMGNLLREQGKLAEAEPYFRKVMVGRRQILGNDHRSTRGSIKDMGLLLQELGKYAEAEPYYRETMEGYRRILGNDHPNTLGSINRMGSLLRSLGKLTDAEPYYREALEGRRRILGDDHPHTLNSIADMGNLLGTQGRLAEAEPYLREALEGRRRILGKDHEDTFLSISSMGALLRSQGKLAEAEPYFREAMEGCRRVLGNDHPSTLGLINNVGTLLQLQGKLAEAEPYYREVMEGRRQVLGKDHPDTFVSISNMGSLLCDLGRQGEAEALGAEAVAGARRTMLTGHADTGRIIGKHAKTLAAMDRYAEAEPLVLEGHSILTSALGSVHSDTVGAIRQLAELYDAWNAAEPNQGHAEKAAKWRMLLEASEEQDREAPASQSKTDTP